MFASLGTTIREFRTLRMCEFFGMANTIFNPKMGLRNVGGEKHKMYKNMITFL
jgi:hypothetical protein